VDTVSARTLEVTTFGFGDSNGNIYIGSNSGGTSNNSANVAIGVSAATNAISTSNSVFIGYGAGLGASNSSNNIVVGYNASGAGNNNIYIGSNDGGGTSSSNNIYIGNGLSNTGSVTNKFQLGFPGSILMTGDFSNKQLGINTTPSYTLDVCGDFRVTERYGTFILGHDTSLNLTTNIQSTNPGSKALLNVVGDISAQVIYGTVAGSLLTPSIALGDGTATAPSHGFSNATGYGMFYSSSLGPNRVGLAANSNERVSITSGGNVGIGITAPNSTLDVSGNIASTTLTSQQLDSSRIIVNTYIRNNTSGSLWDISGGNMKISSNLNVGTITVGDVSSSGTFYGNYVATSITSSNLVVPGYIRNDTSGSLLDISGGNMRLTQRLDGSGITVSNYIRNALTPSLWDISGGNMRLTQRFDGSGITVSNYIRNALTPSTLDISGGNISNSATTTSSNFIGTATASNQIGGIILSNYRYQGGNPFTTNIYANIDLGGGYCNAGGSAPRSYPAIAFGFGNSNVGGFRHFIRSRHDIGSVSGNAIDFFTNIGNNQEDSSAPGTNNVLGMSITATGVGIGTTPSSYNLDISGNMRLTQRFDASGIIVSNYIRNALIPTLWDISGGNISNSATTTSSNFIGTATASNQIGGVTLSNSNAIIGGWLRNALTPSTLDISSGSMALSSKLNVGSLASSTYTLDVNAALNPGMALRSTQPAAMRFIGGGSADSNSMAIFHTTNDQGIVTSNTSPFNFYISNQKLLTILSNGFLGLATPSPSYTLDISGNMRSFNNSNNVMGLFNTNYSNYLHIGAWDTTGTTSSNIVLNRFGGNVGIGYTLPLSALEVNSATQIGFANRGGASTSNYQINIRDGNAGGLLLGTYYTGGTGAVSAIQSSDTTSGSNVVANNLLIQPRGGSIGIRSLALPSFIVDISSGGSGFRSYGPNNSFVQSSNQVSGGYGNFQMNGYFSLFSNGSSNLVTSNQIVQFSSETSGKHFIRNSLLGVGTVDPLYTLDVSCGPTTAAVNMSTWPRNPADNMLLVKGIAATTRTGNTLRFNAATQSMNSNILQFSADGTNGNFLRPLKSGIFSIQLTGVVAVNNNYIWMDVSTNDNSNVSYLTAGNPVISFFQGPFTGVSMNFTGYLNASNYYKLRASGDASNTTAWNLSVTFLNEVAGSNTWPL
jgi:hypothetical protein